MPGLQWPHEMRCGFRWDVDWATEAACLTQTVPDTIMKTVHLQQQMPRGGCIFGYC